MAWWLNGRLLYLLWRVICTKIGKRKNGKHIYKESEKHLMALSTLFVLCKDNSDTYFELRMIFMQIHCPLLVHCHFKALKNVWLNYAFLIKLARTTFHPQILARKYTKHHLLCFLLSWLVQPKHCFEASMWLFYSMVGLSCHTRAQRM